MTRELKISTGATVEVINKYGRVAARAAAARVDKPVEGKLTASSAKGVSDAEIKISAQREALRALQITEGGVVAFRFCEHTFHTHLVETATVAGQADDHAP